MDYLSILATFAVVHLLAAASPGPNLIIVSSYASTVSRKSGLLAALGILFGVITWSTAAALGLGVVLTKFPTLYFFIQHAGAAYLIWLGIRMIHDGMKDQYQNIDTPKLRDRSACSIIASGYLVNMTNPKTVVYYGSLFSVLIPLNSPTWVFLAAAIVALLVSLAWWFSVALFFSTKAIRKAFASTRRYIDVLMGGALIYLGIRLASNR
jgi:RhtB (resistance to homoserine/threonine) family protein